jgi:tRNA 2-thiouridine synthesizing protein A
MSNPIVLDNRGLEPPQPMIRTLEKLEFLNDDEVLIIINDRQPMFLFPELEERGYVYEVQPNNSGGYEITISKPE